MGTLESLAKEGGVDLRLGVANEQADRDRRSRRVEAATEEVATRVDDAHLVAGCRTAVDGVDGLRVDPRMPGPDGLHVTGLEADRGHWGQRVIGPARVGVDDYCVSLSSDLPDGELEGRPRAGAPLERNDCAATAGS